MEYGVGVWYSFESKNPLPQLENHSAALVDNRYIYVFGGNSGNEQYNSLFALDTATMEIQQPRLNGALPRGRSAHTSTMYNNKVYVLFGWGGTGNELHDMQILDLGTLAWSEANTIGEKPSARHWQTASLVANRMFVFAGYDGSNQRNDLYILNLDTMTWTKPVTSGDIPCKRANHKAVVVGKNIYVIGGWNGHGACDGVHVLDTETCTWTAAVVSGVVPQARTGCEAILFHNHIVCFGGKDSNKKAHNDVYVLNLDTMAWLKLTTTGTPPSERMNTAGLLVGDRVIYIGGNCEGRKQNDVNVLDLSYFLLAPSIHVPSASLSQDLSQQVNRQEHADVTFIVQGKPIYAHKVLLCARSEYFKSMFTVGMREARSAEVVIPDTRYETFLSLIEFLYTDKDEVDLDGALELLRLANMYDVRRLSALIEMQVAKHIDADTVCQVFQEADTFTCHALRETCLRFILNNFDAVSKQSSFLDLRRDLLGEVLNSR
eukprot:TRINITY_DN13614_c0_g1_i1.p1 TRINITY_DN13614_c0_g1~~TRINITY_DN13614_c0_g1_i1.p1  ORF type:complete len:489 (-),score=78.90 TRINITY_DN13614_c0_g1_i1:38-1504(-)